MKSSQSGFTFLEILIAMLIVSILSGVVGLTLYQYVRKAKVEAARTQIKTFQTALQIFRSEQGRLPTQSEGLELLCHPPSKDADGNEGAATESYLEALAIPSDPWGNTYVYLVPGRHGEPFEIISYGSDGEPGGSGEATDVSSSGLQL